MKAKELAELNNEKRKQLTKENLDYYENLLLFVRLSITKSDQEMEEILAELLDHLLEAQEQGKTAEDIFGDDPKAYADSIVGELPRMMSKEWGLVALMAICYFFACSAIISGIFALFKGGSESYYVGTIIAKVIIEIPLALVLIYVGFRFLRWLFSLSLRKGKEFLALWLYVTGTIGVFMCIHYFMPKFGSQVEIPAYVTLMTGALLFGAGRFLLKKI